MTAAAPCPAASEPLALRQIFGTRLSWSTLGDWVALVYAIGNIPRCSSPQHYRCSQLYCSLRMDDIRACLELEALEQAALLFDKSRYADVPSFYGLGRVWSRKALGAYLVETRNQIARIHSGRVLDPRPKGPRFDPARMPDGALDRLIQTHPDLSVVDRLREERRRRQASASGFSSRSD